MDILAEVRVPLEGMNIHEHCPTGIRHICDMHSSTDASCEVLGERRGERQ